MVKRRVYDTHKHIHFVTFSCYKRRKHLQHRQAKRIVIGSMGSRLAVQKGLCPGFVIVHDHVHALVWFPEPLQISPFMNKWKELTSKTLKSVLSERFPNYWSQIDSSEPIWQSRYYGFNIWSRSKVEEKRDYMHLNPSGRFGGTSQPLAMEFGPLVSGTSTCWLADSLAAGIGT